MRKSIWPIVGAAGLLFIGGAALAAYKEPAYATAPFPLQIANTPGASPDILTQIGLRKSLSATQRNSAAIIAEEARAAASPAYGSRWISFARGLIANAYAESSLIPTQIGDAGKSFGLFQLYTGGGLGSVAQSRGISTSAMLDPRVNARFFVPVALSTRSVASAVTSGDAAEITRAITIDVERPANAIAKASERVGYLNSLFG